MNIGVTTGTMINIISIKSIKNPAIKTTTITKNKNIIGLNADCSIKSTKYLSPPSPRNTNAKVVAPKSIMNTILVSLVVSLHTSDSLLMLNCPCVIVSNIAPKAPTAAASVGYAIPANIDPSTAMINSIGKTKAFTTFFTKSSDLNLSISLAEIAGALSG